MGLKPVDSLVYLYYQCSKCGTKSDDVCLADAQSPYFSLRCHHCGNCDEIEQVGQVKLGFVTTTRPWVREEIERTEKKSGCLWGTFAAYIVLIPIPTAVIFPPL